MITATIQGISGENNREHISACDGKIITGKQAEKLVNQLYDDCYEVDLGSDELYLKMPNGKFFAAMFHPQKDDIGRLRIALIVWDKDTSNELIKQTLEVMGLDYERFLELRREFRAKKVGSKNALIILGGVALLAAVAYFLLKK